MFTRVLIAILAVPLCLFGHYRLAMCAIFQNEAPFLKEWIEFHKLQGVQHFYLYNNNSVDDYLAILTPYIHSGDVTLVNWAQAYQYGQKDQWGKVQAGAYKHCLLHYGPKAKWMAFVDIDEFLFCPSGEKLSRFLSRYTAYGAVCANWRIFGTSNVTDIPPQKCVIETLTKCSSVQLIANKSFKSIAQPKYVKDVINPHSCILKDGFCTVDADGNQVVSSYCCEHEPQYDKICINHYWARTERFYWEQKVPSAAKRGYALDSSVLPLFNICEDLKIQQFVPLLRERMGFNENMAR